jgi:capsular polysaccharide biosynthesis protein
MSTQNEQFIFQEEEQEPFNLKEVVFKYIVHWKWFVLSFLLALVGAFFYLKYQTPLYNIQSSILVKDEKKGTGGQDDLLKQLDIFGSSKVVDNEIEILKSFTLMEKVVKDLNLNVTYGVKNSFRTVEVYDNSPILVLLIKPTDLSYEEPIEVEINGKDKIKLNGKEYPLNVETQTPYGTLKNWCWACNLSIKWWKVFL